MHKIVFLIIAFSPLLLKAQQVTNIRVIQEGVNVVIMYNLTGTKSGETYDVEVAASVDNGKNFSLIPKTINGDITKVLPGNNKKIVWDVLNDLNELAGDGFVFKLNAKTNNPVGDFSANFGTFTDDRDGQIYKWIKIGNQIWMAENLAYLPVVNSSSSISISSPKYYVYGLNSSNIMTAKTTQNYSKYGVLYNWKAALTACPREWLLPLDSEWRQLEVSLVNKSDFSALLGGYVDHLGNYINIGIQGLWWSANEFSVPDAIIRNMRGRSKTFGREIHAKEHGLSVRCIKNKTYSNY